MADEVIPLDKVRAVLRKPPPRTDPNPDPPWSFTADFYDAHSDQTICRVGYAAADSRSIAAQMRHRADLMIQSAQAFRRDAELLEPYHGRPFAILLLSEAGVRLYTMSGVVQELSEAAISAQIDTAASLLLQRKREAD